MSTRQIVPLADASAADRETKSPVVDAAAEPWSLAEMRVLAVGYRMRAPGLGGAAPRGALLETGERTARLAALEALWAAGCRRVVDEVLFRDIAARHPLLAARMRRRLRRCQSSSSAGTGIGRP